MNLISGGCVFLLCLIASKVISEKFQKRADLIFSAFERFIFLGDKNDDFFVFDKDKQLK